MYRTKAEADRERLIKKASTQICSADNQITDLLILWSPGRKPSWKARVPKAILKLKEALTLLEQANKIADVDPPRKNYRYLLKRNKSNPLPGPVRLETLKKFLRLNNWRWYCDKTSKGWSLKLDGPRHLLCDKQKGLTKEDLEAMAAFADKVTVHRRKSRPYPRSLPSTVTRYHFYYGGV